jgi:hypothetical protein
MSTEGQPLDILMPMEAARAIGNLKSTRFHNKAGSLDPSTLWLTDDQRLGRKEPVMIIVGIDYHPSFQEIAF